MSDPSDAVFRADLFEGRTVLVSGASSGIGLAIARGFTVHGASVIGTGSSEQKIETARNELANERLRFAVLDVRRVATVDAFVGRLSRLDVLVNAQGVARPADEFRDEVFEDVIAVNLTSAMRLANAARPKAEFRGDRTVCGTQALGDGGRSGGGRAVAGVAGGRVHNRRGSAGRRRLSDARGDRVTRVLHDRHVRDERSDRRSG